MNLQIVESSQMDLKNEEQQRILDNATHFNPVDLVCGIKNYKNQKFDLSQFVDHNSGFIVQRSSLFPGMLSVIAPASPSNTCCLRSLQIIPLYKRPSER